MQDGQALRNPGLASEVPKSAQNTESNVQSNGVRRANTISAAPTSLLSIEGNGSSHHGEGQKDDAAHRGHVTGVPADETHLDAHLPARPATSFESNVRHQQHKAPIFSKQSPERRPRQRRQSIETQNTTRNRLFDARSRLRSIGEGTTRNRHESPSAMHVSPIRREPDIRQLEDLIDHAIDEQAKLDDMETRTEQSTRLRSVTAKGSTSKTSPSNKRSVAPEPVGSPVRHGRSNRSSSRPRESIPVPRSQVGKDSDHLSVFSGQHISSTRKQRMSTESVLPRSSLDSMPSADRGCPSIYSSPEMKAVHEIFHLHPFVPCVHAPSPVKQRAAAFEEMALRDKHTMHEQPHKPNGTVQVKKQWWLERLDNGRASHAEGKIRPETAPAPMGSRNLQRNNATSTRIVAKPAKSGPIPLALPQLVTSRGRGFSTSSQSEDLFEAAPQSQAALSRLPPHVSSARAAPPASDAQDIDNETKAPLFNWKPLTPNITAPAGKTGLSSPEKSSLEANAGSDIPEPGSDATSQPQQRAKDLMQAVNQDTASQNAQGQDSACEIDMALGAITHRPVQHSHQSQAPSPEREILGSTAPAKQDHTSAKGKVYGMTMVQVGGAETHREELGMEQWGSSSGDLTVDDEKEVVVVQNDGSTGEHGKTATTSGIEVSSWQSQSKDGTPLPLMLGAASDSASASGPSSPGRGRALSRTLARQSTVMNDADEGNRVTVSRSTSRTGNVRVTVEVRTPQGSPIKGKVGKDGVGGGNGKGGTVVIVTTDLQGGEEGRRSKGSR